MNTKTQYSSGGVPVPFELFPAAAPGPAVVLAYGSDGMVDNAHGPWATMLREYARDLATQGVTALIPDYFARTGTRPGDVDVQHGAAEQIWRHRDEWTEAIQDAVAHAQTLPGVIAARVGLLGFSLGGHLCLRARGRAKAVVEFFAPSLDGLGPGASAGLPVQIHHGTDDFLPFDDNAKAIARDLAAIGAIPELWTYKGATHGFAGPLPANAAARPLAKSRTLAFFRTHL